MFVTSIVNPATGRKVRVKGWEVESKWVYDTIAANNYSVKAVSWALLNDKQSTSTMESQLGGDAAESNFALAVFEQALDWRIGSAAFDFIKAIRAQFNKRPKAFKVLVARNGNIFIQTFSGDVILWDKA